jgi:hypothetical protein
VAEYSENPTLIVEVIVVEVSNVGNHALSIALSSDSAHVW